MTQWHFGRPSVPISGMVLSIVALAIPLLASTLLWDTTRDYEALIWLSALIPAFLLAFYRGWRGVAVGFAAAMAALTSAQVLVLTTEARLPDWPLMLGITLTFISISLLLGAVVQRLHEARAYAESLALYDSLTSLPNRRYFDLMLDKAFAAAARGVPLVVVVFDLDHFKAFNDQHGHLAGDAALREFAGVLSRNTRRMNTSARVGGEEFMSLVSASTVDGALVFVQRIQEGLARCEGLPAPISVSIGAAAYTQGMRGAEELVAAADAALYEAKRRGRNRAVVAGRDQAVAAGPAE
jgi:diguanylate cyclase (GGDEF)-like protein